MKCHYSFLIFNQLKVDLMSKQVDLINNIHLYKETAHEKMNIHGAIALGFVSRFSMSDF